MKVSPEVMAVLDQCTIEGPLLFLPTTRPNGEEYRLERKLYEGVNQVLACLGGKWNRKAGAHVFSAAPDADIEAVMITGEVRDWRKELQFFPTPREIVVQLVDLAAPEFGMRVLEPSAGTGAIAAVIVERTGDLDNLTTVEIDERFCGELQLRDFHPLCQDFLTHQGTYDRIIANPPFTGQQDVLHVTHMHELLAPGGRIVSVMAAGIRFRENRRSVEFRDLVNRNAGHFINLPEGAFQASGTMVNTCVVVLPKL